MILWILSLSIGEFLHGYSIGEMSINRDNIIEYSNLGHNEDTYFWAVSMVPIGAAISSFLSGPLSYYGRRKCLLLANVILILGKIVMIIPNISIFLFIGRFIVGISVGLLSALVPLFILEISPIHK